MNMYLWDNEGKKKATFPIRHTNRISKMVWHPNMNTCLSTSFDKTWAMWDVESQQCLYKQPGHDASVYGIALHPDGGLCATSDLGGHIRLWDVRKGQHVWGMKKHVQQVFKFRFFSKKVIYLLLVLTIT
eukprot:UN17389